MSEDEALKQKVRDMAKLSMLTDRVSDVQAKNLKMYPFVFFEGVTSVAISYDLSNDLGLDVEEDKKKFDVKYKFNSKDSRHLRVAYYIKLDESLNHHLSKRFEAIEQSVRNLFWKEVSVEVYFNEKQVYKSV